MSHELFGFRGILSFQAFRLPLKISMFPWIIISAIEHEFSMSFILPVFVALIAVFLVANKQYFSNFRL